MNAWGKDAERFEKELRHDPQRCAAAGACDRADMIVHDLDRLKDLTTLLERPMDLIGGYRTSPELKGALRRQ